MDYFTEKVCAALCAASHENATAETDFEEMPIHKYGVLFSYAHQLVSHMRENAAEAELAFQLVPLLPPIRSYEEREKHPSYHEYVNRFYLPCLSHRWQSVRLERFPDPLRDLSEVDQEAKTNKIGFTYDAVHLPPFAWVDAFNGRYMNWYGEALAEEMPMPNNEAKVYQKWAAAEEWRMSGFSLWDKERVKYMKRSNNWNMVQTGWVLWQ